MKKFIQKLIILAFLSVPFYIITLCLWADVFPNALKQNVLYYIGGYGHMYSRLQEAKITKNVDILFLGSSHAYRGFNTELFREKGYHTFNLGSPSQTPMQAKVLLKRYLDSLNPKLVVQDIYLTTFSTDCNPSESALDLISNDDVDYLALEMALDLNDLRVYNTLMYSYYRDVFYNDNDFIEPVYKPEYQDTYIKGGYLKPPLKYFENRTVPKQTFEYREDQFKHLDDIIQMLKDKNIPLVFVQAPVPKTLFKSYENSAIFDSIIKTKKQPYYDFNKLMTVDDSLYFFDDNHLNTIGAKKFNNRLIEILKDNKIL